MRKSKNNIIEVVAVVGGIIGLIINTYNQHKLKEENPDRDFDYKSLILAGIFGSLVGGASASLLEFIFSLFDSKEELFNEKDEVSYLFSVIGSYEPDEIDKLVYRKGRKIKIAINSRYHYDLLGRASNQGSVAQGTALSGLSDLDILVKFKKTSFSSEDEMYDSIYKFFKNDFNDSELIDVRRQKVSIGLTFEIKGYQETIDIVPALRTDFVKGKNEYNLHKNPKLTNDRKKIKMNPHKQLEFGDYAQEKKEVISLIKVLKKTQNLPIKSFLIKELTRKAFDKKQIPITLNNQLLMTLKFIRTNIRTIVVKSPDNPNSIISDSISTTEKELIYETLDSVINDIYENKDNLHEYFPTRR